jgi:HAE1 family hydrophobic/amphiphilic exporter-1
MSITSLSVNRPTLVVVLFSILVLFGLVGYQGLTYELLPKLNTPVVTITTIYPGAAPAEVERSVSKPLEDAVSNLENIKSVQAISQESASIIVAELEYGTDVDVAVQEAQRKVNAIRSELPDDAQEPSLGKFSLDELPVMRLGATSKLDETAFSDLFENRIEPELARIEGVARVELVGADQREIRVNVRPEMLDHYKLSILQVTQAIGRANLDFPTGSVKSDDQQVLVRLAGKFSSIDDLRRLTVAVMSDGSPVFLHDVADVVDAKAEVASISRINGQNSLGVLITKTSDGNTVAVSQAVKEKMAALEQRYAAEGVHFTIAQDSADFTLEAANSVIHDLFLAVALVALIMLFFLHNLRNAVIVMVAIPVSIISTFAVMAVAGFTLNLMTLLALSLVIGILVDDSIVVLENIHMHMEHGKSARQAAAETWKEIGLSVTSITLVIVVVFLPIALVNGMISDLLFQFSLVVVASTLISLLVSFTLTPYLASRFTRLTHLDAGKLWHRPLIWFEGAVKGFQDLFRALLRWVLGHKRWTIAGTFALVIASFMLLGKGFIGAEFVSNGDNGEFQLQVELPKDAPIEQTNRLSQEIEDYLLRDSNVINVFTTVGKSSGRTSAGTQPYLAEINVKLVPADRRALSSTEYADQTKRALQTFVAGAKLTAAPVGIVSGASQAPVQLLVQGAELDEVLAFSESVAAAVRTVPGTSEVKISVEGGNPEVAVRIDRERLATLGLSLDQVGATMQNAFTGNDDSRLVDGAYEYPIRVQLDQFDRRSSADVGDLTFLNNAGQLIRLEQFATIENTAGPARLERKDKLATVTVSAHVVGRPTGVVGREVQDQLAGLDRPAGVEVTTGGDLKNQAEAFRSLLLALLASIVLVYLIMVALYDNYVYPFVVMFSVPVALVGAFLALALTMTNLSIFGMLGLIMLIGLVVKNAILIVDFVNHLKAHGRSTYEALVEGTMSRFRPILMTTLAMVIAMIPIAVAGGAGAEWKNGLAWVLIGGLTSSMLLTLLIVPVIYLVVDVLGARLQTWRGRLSARRERQPAAQPA